MTGFNATYDAGPDVSSGDILALHRNENLFVGPDWTVEAARDVVARSGISVYPDATCQALRRALADKYDVSPEQIFVGNGSDEVLADLLALLRLRYGELHILDVGFKVYPLLAERLGYRLEVLPENTFVTGRVRAPESSGLALVDSPNAISGASLDRGELLALAGRSESFLIWDNVYGEYSGDELPRPLPRNVAFVRSFSKYYALAGLRVGYCIADTELVDALLARKDPFNVNGFAQAMALEALGRPEYFGALGEQMASCRDALDAGLRNLGFRVIQSSGIAVLATHPQVAGRQLQQDLLEENIAVRRFNDPLVSDYIRITVPPMVHVRRCLEALARAIGGKSQSE
jgi:histidinol-phosphate aminotransferase